MTCVAVSVYSAAYACACVSAIEVVGVVVACVAASVLVVGRLLVGSAMLH